MSDSFPSPPSDKAPPKLMSYPEALARFNILADAHRELCSTLLLEESLAPATRAHLLALRAALGGSSDGR